MPRRKVYDNIYRICMMSKNNKKLYLEVSNFWYTKDGEIKRQLGWTWDKWCGMQFEKEEDAKKCAQDYFKNFDKWFIDCSYDPIGSV